MPSLRRARAACLMRAGSLTRRLGVRGIERLMRRLHPPEDPFGFEAIVRLKSGALMNCDTRSFVEWRSFYLGDFEPEVRRFMAHHLQPGDWAIDVGANVGIHTLAMSLLVGPGRVIAFEPYSRVAQRLRENIRLNGLDNVDVVEAVVLDGTTTTTLQVPPSTAVNQGMASTLPLGDWEEIEVAATTIDRSVGARNPPDIALIKVDVEGLEAAVIRGAAETLERYRPALIFEYQGEYWSRTGSTLAAVEETLRVLGYSEFNLMSSRGLTRYEVEPAGAVNILATSGSFNLDRGAS